MSPDIRVCLLKEICSFPMIPIKLSVSKMNDNTSFMKNNPSIEGETWLKKLRAKNERRGGMGRGFPDYLRAWHRLIFGGEAANDS